MKKSEIIKITLEITFGDEPKKSLQDFINRALDQGEYYEGFETAINTHELDYQEYEELLNAFKSAYGKYIPKMDTVEKLIDEYLPQSYFSKLSWLVSEKGEIYATDGLRVGKIVDDCLVWVTKRVSYDGINLLKLSESEIIGQWYSPIDESSPWSELKLSVIDGALIKGEIIEF